MIPALIDILFEYLAVYFGYRQPDKTAEFFARGELPVRVADRAAVGGSTECFPETREKADCGAREHHVFFIFGYAVGFFKSAAERRAGERRRVRRIRAVENVLRADIFEQCAKLFLQAEARRVEIDMAHIALEIERNIFRQIASHLYRKAVHPVREYRKKRARVREYPFYVRISAEYVVHDHVCECARGVVEKFERWDGNVFVYSLRQCGELPRVHSALYALRRRGCNYKA